MEIKKKLRKICLIISAIIGVILTIFIIGYQCGRGRVNTVIQRDTIIINPGQQTKPTREQKPMFGTERTGGTMIVIPRPPAETIKVFVRRNSTVQNIGKQPIQVNVIKVKAPLFQFDPAIGVSVLVAPYNSTTALFNIAKWHGDVYAKLKLIDVCPLGNIDIGIPLLYFGTGGWGVGIDIKHGSMEVISADIAFLPSQQKVHFGVAINYELWQQ